MSSLVAQTASSEKLVRLQAFLAFGLQNKRGWWWVCFWVFEHVVLTAESAKKAWGSRIPKVTKRNHNDKVTTAAQGPPSTLLPRRCRDFAAVLYRHPTHALQLTNQHIFSFSVHPSSSFTSPPSPLCLFAPGQCTYQEHIHARRPIKSGILPRPSVKSQKKKKKTELSHPLVLRSHPSRCSATKVAGSDTISHPPCFCSSTKASHRRTGRCSRASARRSSHACLCVPHRKAHLLLYRTFCSRLPVHTNYQVLEEVSSSVCTESFCLNCFIWMLLQRFYIIIKFNTLNFKRM